MRMPGVKAVRQSLRWTRSRGRRRALVLGYHRVSDAPDDALGLNVRVRNFAEHLEAIGELCRPATLGQLAEALRRGNLQPGTLAITFDDGYATVAAVVLPMLERYQVPATVFVTTGRLGEEFWWDEAARSSEKLDQRMCGARVPASSGERDRRRGELRERPEASRTAAGFHRALTEDEIRELAASPYIEIASHSVTHVSLGTASLVRQRRELEESKRVLEEMTGRSVRGFSYPHGSRSRQTIALARATGYAYACGSNPDVVLAGTDLFDLPRFWPPDQGGRWFRRWVERWL